MNVTTEAPFNATLIFAEIQSLKDKDALFASAIDISWTLLTAMLVFFMQAGFAMLEAGAVAPKNAKHILFKNILDQTVGIIFWYSIGYPIAFGELLGAENPFFGIGDYFLFNGDNLRYEFWYFQATFCLTAATIVSGALAERVKTMAYVLYACVMTAVIYPAVVHWIWSPHGWLSAANLSPGPAVGFGVIDFAGGCVVHVVGGTAALVGAWLVGYRNQYSTDPARYRPRFERLVDENRWIVNSAPPNSVSLQAMGVLILFFGFYGFNCGSTLSMANSQFRIVAALIAVNTTISGSVASAVAVLVGRIVNDDKRFSMTDALNGMLAGLVAITSGCSVVEPWASFVIGAVSALAYKLGSWAMLKARIDDPLDAVGVHFAAGVWAIISPGLLASKRWVKDVYGQDAGGLFTHGEGLILGVNVLALVCVIAWVGTVSFIIFFSMRQLNILRISPEQEEAGLGVDIGMAVPQFDIAFGSMPSEAAHKNNDELTDKASGEHSMHASHNTQSQSHSHSDGGSGDHEMVLMNEHLSILQLLSESNNAEVLSYMLEHAKKKKADKDTKKDAKADKKAKKKKHRSSSSDKSE